MDRRSLLKTIVGGLAAGAAVRTWPFRVYSFPSELAEYTSGFYPALCPIALEWELWGAHLTPADINASGFGFSIPEDSHILGISSNLISRSPKLK